MAATVTTQTAGVTQAAGVRAKGREPRAWRPEAGDGLGEKGEGGQRGVVFGAPTPHL